MVHYLFAFLDCYVLIECTPFDHGMPMKSFHLQRCSTSKQVSVSTFRIRAQFYKLVVSIRDNHWQRFHILNWNNTRGNNKYNTPGSRDCRSPLTASGSLHNDTYTGGYLLFFICKIPIRYSKHERTNVPPQRATLHIEHGDGRTASQNKLASPVFSTRRRGYWINRQTSYG